MYGFAVLCAGFNDLFVLLGEQVVAEVGGKSLEYLNSEQVQPVIVFLYAEVASGG